ncbi:hypothetical protein IFM89_006351 [Coptis chinensis]|uniref:Uncharacterized protein n=1 Tax=Coptis chinensis TaxID=261450 RepID=A0A835LV13_9MAGN|nr:hypothetical protein IFM89_006351 [Coptis chinensis]
MLKDVYDLSPTRQVGVLLKANISWKNWKHRLRKVYDRYSTTKCMENIPKRTKKEDWESFIEICSTDEEKIKREKGKLSREHMKLPHTSSRLGCARIKRNRWYGHKNDVFVATHTSKDGSCPFLELRPSLDEIKRLVSLDPYLGEKDLDNDPVAKVIGRDGKGRVRGLGTGVTKTVVHASAPYIKLVEEEKRKRESTYENVKLVMQRLDEETRARKILAEKLEGYAPEFENTSPQPSMINVFDKAKLFREATQLLYKMREAGVVPDTVSYLLLSLKTIILNIPHQLQEVQPHLWKY